MPIIFHFIRYSTTRYKWSQIQPMIGRIMRHDLLVRGVVKSSFPGCLIQFLEAEVGEEVWPKQVEELQLQ